MEANHDAIGEPIGTTFHLKHPDRGQMTFAPETPRGVVADALEESGKEEQARLLRSNKHELRFSHPSDPRKKDTSVSAGLLTADRSAIEDVRADHPDLYAVYADRWHRPDRPEDTRFERFHDNDPDEDTYEGSIDQIRDYGTVDHNHIADHIAGLMEDIPEEHVVFYHSPRGFANEMSLHHHHELPDVDGVHEISREELIHELAQGAANRADHQGGGFSPSGASNVSSWESHLNYPWL